MYFKLNLVVLLCSSMLFGCEMYEEPIITQQTQMLIGNWVSPEYNDTIVTFKRSDQLIEQKYGLAIMDEGNLMERKNAGWCGTPPIFFADFEGEWTNSGSDIYINVAYWGGAADYHWKIVSLSKNKLTIARIEENYHQEQEPPE